MNDKEVLILYAIQTTVILSYVVHKPLLHDGIHIVDISLNSSVHVGVQGGV